MRALQRLRNKALADIAQVMLLHADVPVFSLQVVRRIVLPDVQDLIDRFEKHRVAVGIEIAEYFRIREQSARRDSENETAIEHVVEHRDLCGDGRGMAIGHVHRAGSELDRFRAVDQARQEHQAGRDILGLIGDVLAGIALGESKLIGENKRLAVLAQRLAPILVQRMDGHREEAKLH
jgi:hypothetical protein